MKFPHPKKRSNSSNNSYFNTKLKSNNKLKLVQLINIHQNKVTISLHIYFKLVFYTYEMTFCNNSMFVLPKFLIRSPQQMKIPNVKS